MSPNPKADKQDAPTSASLADDKKNGGYYYDDAHGYEAYDPDAVDELDEEDDDKKKGRLDEPSV